MNVELPRLFPRRKPEGFTPAVQRWSARFPSGCTALHVGFFAVQIPAASGGGTFAADAAYDTWRQQAFGGPHAPISVDHASYQDDAGALNRVTAAYWTDSAAFMAWCHSPELGGWWSQAERENADAGYWREMLTVPLERLETLYWSDYPAALSKALPVDPATYSGYFGAMRDRIALAAIDPLDGAAALPPARPVEARRRYLVVPPHNLAMIRSASYWGRCDAEQQADYEQKLRDPLAQGMDYLRSHPSESGCCSLRFQRTEDATGQLQPETHALAYFLSLGDLERWAEGHASHKVIFDAAIARYQKYGAQNQLRTWHEVFVLPREGQHFEYINCHCATGLLPFFDRIAL
ncbi:phenylacetaldoxime dehydratase family protein [Corticibacter populi]|uniref:Phenylacetaldoxime dehydratase family protein n=1 Tax=Corticibacter populi TaxID=1550736 RepID=A0A3M6QUA0_9BURK|nr:phenylacetaldoxime dehydratase family protein [Corticibacter populi]RMX06607.1 phenylacetaldoxime dehydratase family protein [Corticibacter populi]RZS31823.1 phenylacetaldoxime dehydratase/aldoxime dehydratase [Corticibacter populi]